MPDQPTIGRAEMTRAEAINHIWGLSMGVASEFCCSREEELELAAKTAAALRALGCTEGEIDA